MCGCSRGGGGVIVPRSWILLSALLMCAQLLKKAESAERAVRVAWREALNGQRNTTCWTIKGIDDTDPSMLVILLPLTDSEETCDMRPNCV